MGLIAAGGLNDVIFAVDPDGGLSTVTSWNFRLTNPDTLTTYLSDLEDLYYFQGSAVRLRFVFLTGAETVGDLVTLFSGTIHSLRTRTDIWEFRCSATGVDDIPTVPTKLVEFTDFPNASFGNIGNVLPLAFGDLTTAETSLFDAQDADMLQLLEVDSLQAQYHGGLRAKEYGDVFLYLPDTREFFPIAPEARRTAPCGRALPAT